MVADFAREVSKWLRLGFSQFSSESQRLMEINDLGEFKAQAIERFNGLLHNSIKAGLKANPIARWAAAKVIEAWNVSTP